MQNLKYDGVVLKCELYGLNRQGILFNRSLSEYVDVLLVQQKKITSHNGKVV